MSAGPGCRPRARVTRSGGAAQDDLERAGAGGPAEHVPSQEAVQQARPISCYCLVASSRIFACGVPNEGRGVDTGGPDDGGFLGGEYGQTGESDAFAATLHKVLAATSP